MIRALLLTPLLGALLVPLLHADVLVVDGFRGPGFDYDQVYAAVDAAADGDTILVRQGSYISFVVDGKGLSIVADTDAVVSLIGSIRIRNLDASQSALVQGFIVQSIDSGVGLAVEDCAGPVWVEDCAFFEPYLTQNPVQGCEVSDSAFVALTRCTSDGSRALSPGNAGHGLLVESAYVAVYDSELCGGAGAGGIFGVLEAGHGLLVDGGSVFVSGSTLLGGDGGPGSSPFGCGAGGDGGAGLLLTGGAPVARLIGSIATGGAAGTTDPPCTPGVAGEGTVVQSGILDVVSTTARSLDANGPLRSGDTLVVDFAGEPGDVVWWILSVEYAPVVLLGSGNKVGGPFLTNLGAGVLLVVGTLDGSGSLQLAGGVPPVPVTGALFMQSILFGTDGEIIMSSGSALTLLDDSL